jgi:hypothetical protein
MRLKGKIVLGLAVLFLIGLIGLAVLIKEKPGVLPEVPGLPKKTQANIGEVVDEFNGVKVFYNGSVDHVAGRNRAPDGYNLGLKYQCVEFVKRYYYERLGHKMPNSYGHAKDFFNGALKDGQRNADRGLIQFSNPSKSKPKAEDLLVFDGWMGNPFGHVCIISRVGEDELEIVQQNPGVWGSSRERYGLSFEDGKWEIESGRILGWLRRP